MAFQILDIEQLNWLSDAELLQYAIQSEEEVKTQFIVEYIDLSEHITGIQYKKKLSFDDIKHLFKYDNKAGEYKFPSFDERNLTIYRMRLNGGYKVPTKGFWWVINSSLNQQQMGLTVVKFKMGKMVRNDNDWRWEKDDKPEFEEEKLFYYDYENHKYIQVFMDKKPNQKKKAEKEQNKRVLNIKEYELRAALIDYLDERMAAIEDKYSVELNSVTKDVQKLSKEHTSNSFEQLFNKFIEFKKYFDTFFSVKLTVKHVDINEFLKLKQGMDSIHKEVETGQASIIEIRKKHNEESLSFVSETHKYFEDVRKVHSQLKNIVAKIIQILEPRIIKPYNPKKEEKLTQQGYYTYTDKRLYPSLGTIELRRYKSLLPMKTTDWEKYEKKLLKELTASKNLNNNQEQRIAEVDLIK
ncbi:hypothetical protein ACFY5J_28705 [Peribacillus butanolivorans]|uniref:hypothetical protein n=1 Tax=Peribacillus butanolivorans TaxID=421767 RepID=UPI0036B35CF2